MESAPCHVVVDANVPFASSAFAAFGTVHLLPSDAITPAAVRDADILVVRSPTRVDAALLSGSAVRFVGTATIGTDHVDKSWLRRQGIGFASAPGSNAESVVEYVLASLLAASARQHRPLRGLTLGIVGVGNVGKRLLPRAQALGLEVLACDPPRARQEGGVWVSLEELLSRADLVSLHVPLAADGPDATHHLIGRRALEKMRPGAWLVNAARGSVVDSGALRQALQNGRVGAAVLDVWEGEPTPDPALLARTLLATPHIAGYSFDGKVQGTRDIVRAVEGWAGRAAGSWDAAAALAPRPEDKLVLTPPSPTLPEHQYLYALARQMYDVEADDARMRRLLALPPEAHAEYFRSLRRDYPRRRRWGLFTLPSPVPQAYRRAVADGLGVQMGG